MILPDKTAANTFSSGFHIKKWLECYRDSLREIKLLEKRISRLKNNKDLVFTGSELEALLQIYEERHVCLKKETIRIEQFINSVNDSKMRQIIILKYLEGKTWQQVAFAIGEYDEQYPRRRFNAFADTCAKNKLDEKDDFTFL